jgi:hypothetical protein
MEGKVMQSARSHRRPHVLAVLVLAALASGLIAPTAVQQEMASGAIGVFLEQRAKPAS